MIIKLNAGKDLNIHELFDKKLKALLTEGLKHFSQTITRLEVHLSDENGTKKGENDKRCVLEARIEGRQPIAVTANAHTHEETGKAAIEKLRASLETILGRMKNHPIK